MVRAVAAFLRELVVVSKEQTQHSQLSHLPVAGEGVQQPLARIMEVLVEALDTPMGVVLLVLATLPQQHQPKVITAAGILHPTVWGVVVDHLK